MSWNSKWRPEWDQLLGTMPDDLLAQRVGVRRTTVSEHRRDLGVKRFSRKQKVICTWCWKTIRRKQRRKVTTCRSCKLQKVREKSRRWYADHKGVVDSGAWSKAHPEERRAYRARWREKNRKWLRVYERLYARKKHKEAVTLLAELPCEHCGMKHTTERRLSIIRRMLPARAHDIREAWPCIWGEPWEPHTAGEARFYRDLRSLGAVRGQGGVYGFPERVAA